MDAFTKGQYDLYGRFYPDPEDAEDEDDLQQCYICGKHDYNHEMEIMDSETGDEVWCPYCKGQYDALVKDCGAKCPHINSNK